MATTTMREYRHTIKFGGKQFEVVRLASEEPPEPDDWLEELRRSGITFRRVGDRCEVSYPMAGVPESYPPMRYIWWPDGAAGDTNTSLPTPTRRPARPKITWPPEPEFITDTGQTRRPTRPRLDRGIHGWLSPGLVATRTPAGVVRLAPSAITDLVDRARSGETVNLTVNHGDETIAETADGTLRLAVARGGSLLVDATLYDCDKSRQALYIASMLDSGFSPDVLTRDGVDHKIIGLSVVATPAYETAGSDRVNCIWTS